MRFKLFKLIVWLRVPVSHILWWIARIFLKVQNPGKWLAVKSTYTAQQLSELMESLKYKADPILGTVDYTLYDLDLLFNDTLTSGWFYGRDCDDASLAWFEWAIFHDFNCWQITLCDGGNILSSHMATVYQQPNGLYRLCNWQLYPTSFISIEHAVKEFQEDALTVHGKYLDLMWTVSREYQN